MKKYFIAPILIFLSCSGSDLDCEKFKIGKFEINDPTQGYETVIERNDSIQVEKNLTDGTESLFFIEWKSRCEYTLELISTSGEIPESIVGKKLNVRITSTDEDEYNFEATMDGVDFKLEDTAKRID